MTYLDEIQDIEELLKDKIKHQLKIMHKISKMNDYPVTLKRINSENNIITINSSTANNVFTSSIDDLEFEIFAMVTRFNSFTGNGRLLTSDRNQTISFGFRRALTLVNASFLRKVSENLHNNNTVKSDARVYLKLKVVAMTNMVGDVIKYLIVQVG